MRSIRYLTALTAGALAVALPAMSLPAGADVAGGAGGDGSSLASGLLDAVRAQHFDEVVDYMPPGTEQDRAGPGRGDGEGLEADPRSAPGRAQDDPPPAHQMPNLDVAVIELDRRGRPTDAANVLFSPQHPDGVVVPLDEDFDTDSVRWRRWNTEEWDAGSTGSVDLVPGREDAELEHMATYPASVLKLMVGFGILRLVDRGELALDTEVAYEPADTSCGSAGTATVEEWFDLMITVSDNRASCALIKLLYDRGAADELNAWFQELGLPTLQMIAARPETGGGWIDTMTMTSMETAKLLLIVNGSPGVLWRAPDGEPVTRHELSRSSREFFYGKLAEQGLNQVLTTTNWCGREYPAEGLLQKVDERWIDPEDGTMTVADRYYGQDVRPCNERAEVTFAHKTGLTNHGGVDAGIVHNVPGAPDRDYVVVVNSNLGLRYGDANKPADPPGVYPVSYTEKFGLLGRAVDAVLEDRRAGR